MFAVLAVVMQFCIAQRGEATWSESFALGVAVFGFLLLPLLADANSLGLAFAVVLAISAAWEMRRETGSVIGLLACTSLLSMLGRFIRNRMENQRQLERRHRPERQAENQRLGALAHDALASTLTQALAVARDLLASTELPAAQARRLDLVSENLSTALEELQQRVLREGGTSEAVTDEGVWTLRATVPLAEVSHG